MKTDLEIAGFLFEQARDIILVIDATHGRIIGANRAAELAYQYTRDELLQRTVFDLRVEAEPAPVAAQMRIAAEHGLLFETVHRRKDGTTFPVEVSSRGTGEGPGSRLFSIIRDITERKRFEAEREQLLVATQLALATRDDFLMIASHELRAPVAHISLQLQQLRRLIDRGMTRAHLRVVGEALHAEAGRLTALIDALLDAHATRGGLALERADMDLADVVDDVTLRLQARAAQAGSTLAIAVPSLRGCWDRLRLEQVVTNLLLNALKYGRGQPVEVSGHDEGPAVALVVRDHGIGVAREDLARIFDKFERAVPPTYGGLGLGLYITRQIVEAHHGRVDVESAPGAGATFRVTLPRAASSARGGSPPPGEELPRPRGA